MNILVITSWYPSEKKPYAGIFIKEQVKVLSRNHNVIVAIIEVDYNSKVSFFRVKKRKQESENIIEFFFLVNKSFPIFNQFNFYFTVYRGICKEIDTTKIDIVHAHVTYPSGFLAYIISRHISRPFIITEHTGIFESQFRSLIHKIIILFTLSKAKRIIAVSRHSEKSIKNYTRKPINVVYNLLPFNKIMPIVKSEEMVKHIGFLGVLDSDIKGLDILLKAFSQIEGNYLLEIGGAGELLNEYKAMADNLNIGHKCIFHGAINPEYVPFFMQKIDFFVLSSRNESFGIVIIEAMAAGKPVIATKCGGPEEIVIDKTGYLVEKENVEALKEGIIKMIQTLDSFNGIDISNYVKERFGERIFLETIDKIYNEL